MINMIMDYEKKYKEIISLAKSYKGNNLKEFLDLAFPELTDSKDDRIRKRLIKYFKFYQSNPDLTLDVNTWQGEKVSDILAYLEKQKDERELGFTEGKVEGIRQTCQEIKDAMFLYEPKDLTPFEFTFRDYIDSAIRYCLSGEGYQQYIKEWAADLLNLEKQKEQKPEKINITEMVANYRVTDEYVDGEYKGKPVNCMIRAYEQGIRDTLLKVKEQKPAEWSEKDEDMRDTIIRDLKRLGGDIVNVNPAYKPEIDWLKYLPERFNLQPKQEWSEEDENRFRNLIYLVERSNEGKGTKEGFVKFINRLKSLCPQPHWKPSKEQINALKIVARGFPADDPGAIDSLLADLQKLL